MKVKRCRRCGAPCPTAEEVCRRCARNYVAWDAANGPACTRCGGQARPGKSLCRGCRSYLASVETNAARDTSRAPTAKVPKKKAPRKKSVTHVGLISSGPTLTPSQRIALGQTLALIGFKHPGRVFLHHGCQAGADEFAHNIARALRGWRIHGHPSHEEDGSATPWGKGIRPGMVGAPDVVHYSVRRNDRDIDILRVCDIILVVLPYPEYSRKNGQPGILGMIVAAESDGREVLCIPEMQDRGERPVPGMPAALAASADAPSGTAKVRTSAGPKSIAANRGVPVVRKVSATLDEWYEDAIRTLGARAEVQDDVSPVLVLFKIAGKVFGQFPEPRGREVALKYVNAFNKRVAAGRLNPPLLGEIHR